MEKTGPKSTVQKLGVKLNLPGIPVHVCEQTSIEFSITVYL